MKGLREEMAEIKGLVITLTGLVKSLAKEVRDLKEITPEVKSLTPERCLAIKRAAGNPALRKLWNEQRAKELEAGRPQGPRS